MCEKWVVNHKMKYINLYINILRSRLSILQFFLFLGIHFKVFVKRAKVSLKLSSVNYSYAESLNAKFWRPCIKCANNFFKSNVSFAPQYDQSQNQQSNKAYEMWTEWIIHLIWTDFHSVQTLFYSFCRVQCAVWF